MKHSYKGVEISLYRTRLEAMRGSLEGKIQRGRYMLMMGFELLQIVSKLDTGRCASNEAEP